jgi:hypothetical protein
VASVAVVLVVPVIVRGQGHPGHCARSRSSWSDPRFSLSCHFASSKLRLSKVVLVGIMLDSSRWWFVTKRGWRAEFEMVISDVP